MLGVKANLLSVEKFTNLGYKVLFDSTRSLIFTREVPSHVFI
jgi:hypothetical protein